MKSSNKSFPRGSEWRKWDLHVHSPCSLGNSEYEKFLEQIANSPADVIGINDYNSLDGYTKTIQLIKRWKQELNIEKASSSLHDTEKKEAILNKLKTKTLIPVIEFRMNNVLMSKSGSAVNLNFHIILNVEESEDLSINGLNPENKVEEKSLLEKLTDILGSLKCKEDGGEEKILSNIPVANKRTNKIKFNYFDVIRAFKENEDSKNHFLVWLPYDEYGGISEIDPVNDSYFKSGLVKVADFIGSANEKTIDFFLWKSSIDSDGKPKMSEDDFKQYLDKRKPCIKGSDSHSLDYPLGKLKDENSNSIDKYCWIKTDPTWEGLKQVLVNPEDRVFLGEYPEKQAIVEKNKNKFIDRIEINLKEDIKDQSKKWFDGTTLQLNHDLVAIIGNKGSGKSALADVIACVDGKRNKNFSFLTNKRFHTKADKFLAELLWRDKEKRSQDLKSENYKNENLEDEPNAKVEYVPQYYFEKLCTESVDSENVKSKKPEFEGEIHRIIFSHISINDRRNKENLDDLLSNILEEQNTQINALRNQIKIKNQEIVEVEEKLSESSKRKNEDDIKQLRRQIQSLGEKPQLSIPEAEELQQIDPRINKQKHEIQFLEAQISELGNNSKNYQKKLNNLTFFETALQTFNIHYSEFENKFKEYSTDVNLKFHFDEFEQLFVKQQNDLEVSKEEILVSKQNIEGQFASVNISLQESKNELDQLIKQQDEQTQKSEKEKKELAVWMNKRKELAVDLNKLRLKKHKTQFSNSLQNLYSTRWETTEKIFKLIKQGQKVLESLLNPLFEIIKENEIILEKKVQFNVSIRVDQFDISKFTNNQKKGFQKDDQKDRLGKLKEYNFEQWNGNLPEENCRGNSRDAIVYILESFFELWRENESKADLDTLKSFLNADAKVKELYDYIFGLKYLEPFYQIKYEDKILEQLSAGQRGALLLTFYLLLDTNEYPIIIDQPEANLDNESIVTKLQPLIKQAKKKRQIIIVTHNPNIALCCDAEQIIYCEHHSDKPCRSIKYTSGSIESKEINKKLLKILEGGRMAFDTRNKKYI
jgi:ABC-type lipoprotein export system ATPase subunit